MLWPMNMRETSTSEVTSQRITSLLHVTQERVFYSQEPVTHFVKTFKSLKLSPEHKLCMFPVWKRLV